MATATQAVQTAVAVSMADVKGAAKACAFAATAERGAATADAKKKIALMALFEPMLGIKTEEDLKALSLKEIRRRIRDRISAGSLKLKGISLQVLFECIKQTQVRRNVAWKDVFVAEIGESRATAVIEDTPETHSYKVVAP